MVESEVIKKGDKIKWRWVIGAFTTILLAIALASRSTPKIPFKSGQFIKSCYCPQVSLFSLPFSSFQFVKLEDVVGMKWKKNFMLFHFSLWFLLNWRQIQVPISVFLWSYPSVCKLFSSVLMNSLGTRKVVSFTFMCLIDTNSSTLFHFYVFLVNLTSGLRIS